jgi:pimeloyl-ACP methyl ester carboxylesterase
MSLCRQINRAGYFALLILSIGNSYSQNTTVYSHPNQVNEERYVMLNDIEQWITIRGDSTKPAILFLHGGPGNPLSPYAEAIYGKWEKDFMLVQWDQRGAGRTYARNAPPELTPAYLKAHPLTIGQMTADGMALTNYILQRFKKQQIILFATSWGSVLGVHMALKHPELFHAYIGHSQVVNFPAALLCAYEQVYKMAGSEKDINTIEILDSIGKPPYELARTTGLLMRIIKKYQEKKSVRAPASWFKPLPGYDNEKDEQHRSDGDDYSFVNYTGDKKLGITSMGAGINFLNDELLFKIPVYFIQGANDIQTPKVMNEEFYNKIKAPYKDFIVLPNTDHGFNQAVMDAQYKIMTGFILPMIKDN